MWRLSPLLAIASSENRLGHKIPSEYQAASLARQLLRKRKEATIMTKLAAKDMGFGSELQDYPFGQVELIAEDCDVEHFPGSFLVFSSQLEVTTWSWVNYANNVSVHIREPIDPKDKSADPLLFHRFTAMGAMKPLPWYNTTGYKPIADCFFATHPDARAWEHFSTHDFRFYRFTPAAASHSIHYVGGFGNTHYIGGIRKEYYDQAPNSATCKAWSQCPATDDACCPRDNDNLFDECCATGPDINVESVLV